MPLDSRNDVDAIVARNGELTKMICEMTKEIKALKEENVGLRKTIERNDHLVDRGMSGDRFTLHNLPQITNVQGALHEEFERKRSLVIVGVPEFRSGRCFDKVAHDFSCVLQLLDYLSVDCFLVLAYCTETEK